MVMLFLGINVTRSLQMMMMLSCHQRVSLHHKVYPVHSVLKRSLYLDKGGYSVNTDYVKVPVFLDFFYNFPGFSPIPLPYFPILCKTI